MFAYAHEPRWWFYINLTVKPIKFGDWLQKKKVQPLNPIPRTTNFVIFFHTNIACSE